MNTWLTDTASKMFPNPLSYTECEQFIFIHENLSLSAFTLFQM